MTFDPVRICAVLDDEGVDFDGWRAGATHEHVGGGAMVLVASLDDVIDSERTADRAKDRSALPYLESLRDEIARERRAERRP